MKAQHIFYIIALTLLLPLQSCFINEDKDLINDAESNFELLWKICDERYCYFDYKNIDWDSIHTEYRARVNNQMSDDELFKVCADMLAELKDGHVNLYYDYNNSKYWKWFEDYPANYDERIVLEHYLNNDYFRKSGFVYKILPENIGYIHYSAFTENFSNELINHILTTFKDCKGIIFDIRDNGGGNMSNVNRLACHFTNENNLCGYQLYKTGKGHNDLGDTIPTYIQSPDNLNNTQIVKFMKPVALLTNRSVYSAANDFVRTMKVLPNVTVIGDKSGGGGGIPIDFELLNGWHVRLSTAPMLDIDKQHTEFGIDPTPGYKVDMAADATLSGKDAIIDTAIEHILSK